MGSKLAVTDSHKHKIAKKIFFTDDERVHRKVKKMFLTENGVHRMVYSSGTRWKKYSCEATEVAFQYELIDVSGESDTWEVSGLSYSEDYTFDSRNGFQRSGRYDYADTAEELRSASGYIVESETVYSILDVSIISEEEDGYCTAIVELEIVAQCESITYTQYEKGSEYFGIVEVEEEEIPDGDKGWLEEGGPNESYCVVTMEDEEFGHVFYYYEKIEE